MLDRLRLARDDSPEPHPQDAVLADRPVATDPRSEHDLDAEFLAAFAHQRCFVGLARVDLSPGQLPESGESGRLGALRGEQPIAVDDRGSDDNLHPRSTVAQSATIWQPDAARLDPSALTRERGAWHNG